MAVLFHLVFSRLALSAFTRMNTNSSDEFFQATNHAEQTFRKMESYLQHKQLCDVLLIAGDHRIPAHRSALLSDLIDYFITFDVECTNFIKISSVNVWLCSSLTGLPR